MEKNKQNSGSERDFDLRSENLNLRISPSEKIKLRTLKNLYGESYTDMIFKGLERYAWEKKRYRKDEIVLKLDPVLMKDLENETKELKKEIHDDLLKLEDLLELGARIVMGMDKKSLKLHREFYDEVRRDMLGFDELEKITNSCLNETQKDLRQGKIYWLEKINERFCHYFKLYTELQEKLFREIEEKNEQESNPE